LLQQLAGCSRAAAAAMADWLHLQPSRSNLPGSKGKMEFVPLDSYVISRNIGYVEHFFSLVSQHFFFVLLQIWGRKVD
jgi:hypothetical protein